MTKEDLPEDTEYRINHMVHLYDCIIFQTITKDGEHP